MGLIEGTINIKLLSDSCISTGDVYNTSIDCDVCYDSKGFPYIPAKRIKGCLREAALEIRDFAEEQQEAGCPVDYPVTDGFIENIFGAKGNKRASLIIGNARIKDYAKMVSDLDNYRKSGGKHQEYTHRQTVLNQFTYVRYQTSIDYKTGVAKDTSLRAIRVINKGLEFEAPVQIRFEDDEKESVSDIFSAICKNVKLMGMNRTRGMGEVRLEFVPDGQQKSEGSSTTFSDEEFNVDVVRLPDGRFKLLYNIHLNSPLLIKSVAGGQTKTEKYIDGSKILGVIAENLKSQDYVIEEQSQSFEEKFQSFIKMGKLICSNAYISQGDKRYTPISASVYSVKNEGNNLRDKTCENQPKEQIKSEQQYGSGEQFKSQQQYGSGEQNSQKQQPQLCQISDCFVSSDTDEYIVKLTVDTEYHYHHSRPENKAIGRAKDSKDNNDSSSFFQMASISEGQDFKGFITGSKKQIEYVYRIFKENPNQRIGYGKTSEYGDVEFTIVKIEKVQGEKTVADTEVNESSSVSGMINTASSEKTKLSSGEKFVVKLNSPTIVYNDYGMYSTEAEVLLQYIAELIHELPDALEIKNRFLRYRMLGGYNTTWNAHKPVVYSFDMGTTLVIEAKKDLDISALSGAFIGERTSEGYGEVAVYFPSENYERGFVDIEASSAEAGCGSSAEVAGGSSAEARDGSSAEAGGGSSAGAGDSNAATVPTSSGSEVQTTNIIEKVANYNAKIYLKSLARQRVENKGNISVGVSEKTETGKNKDIKSKSAEGTVDVWVYKYEANLSAVVANLIMMCKENDTFSGFVHNIEDRFDKDGNTDKKDKLKVAQKIAGLKTMQGKYDFYFCKEDGGKECKDTNINNNGKSIINYLADMVEDMYPESNLTEDEIYKTYMTAWLNAIKYRIKGEKTND